MMVPTLFFFLLAGVLFALNARHGTQGYGLKMGWQQFWRVLPIILAAFILAGLIEAMIPEPFVRRWLASEAGFRGILLGTAGGMMLAMGPYASFPIIASIYGSGAGLGTVISMITAWAVLGTSKFPYEAGFLGMRFFLTRMAIGMPYCLGAGLVAHLLDLMLRGS